MLTYFNNAPLKSVTSVQRAKVKILHKVVKKCAILIKPCLILIPLTKRIIQKGFFFVYGSAVAFRLTD